MPTNSSRLKIPYPNPTDQANVPQDMQNLATGTIDGAVMFYQSSSSADTTVPTPSGSVQGAVSGQIWWCANPAMSQYGLNYWDGSAWRQLPDALIGTSDPTNNNAIGKLFYNTSTKTLNYYNGSGWVPMTLATGQITPGTNGQVLTTSGSSTVWADPTATNKAVSGVGSTDRAVTSSSTLAQVNTLSAITGFTTYAIFMRSQIYALANGSTEITFTITNAGSSTGIGLSAGIIDNTTNIGTPLNAMIVFTGSPSTSYTFGFYAQCGTGGTVHLNRSNMLVMGIA